MAFGSGNTKASLQQSALELDSSVCTVFTAWHTSPSHQKHPRKHMNPKVPCQCHALAMASGHVAATLSTTGISRAHLQAGHISSTTMITATTAGSTSQQWHVFVAHWCRTTPPPVAPSGLHSQLVALFDVSGFMALWLQSCFTPTFKGGICCASCKKSTLEQL